MSNQTNPIRCFDIGGSKILAADVWSFNRVDLIEHIPTPTHDIQLFINELRRLCPTGAAPIAVALAGVIEPSTGCVTSANIPCLNNRHIETVLVDALHRPVVLINDSDAFALAQAKVGLARNHQTVLAIILGTGVGGSLIIDGRLVRGSRGQAGEWGHMPACANRLNIGLPHLICNCGQPNCVDLFGGARGLERIHYYLHQDKQSSHGILEAWHRSDKNALCTVDCWLDVVGGALAGIVNVIDPSIIVAAGGLASDRQLMKALDFEVSQRRLGNHQPGLLQPVDPARHDTLIGAALFADIKLR